MSMEPESPETRQGARHWTLSDIVEAPVVPDLAIARDGHRALYVIRHADLATNAKRSRLHRVELATGHAQELRQHRKRVREGKIVAARVDIGGVRICTK